MSSVSRSNSKISAAIKSNVLQEILAPNCKFEAIAKNYNLSTKTLYRWRQDHFDETKQKPLASNNFIELVANSSKSADPKLSKISLSINNISLSISGSISNSCLTKILLILSKEASC